MGINNSAATTASINSNFQESIRQYVGRNKGMSFKAYPTCISSQIDNLSIKKTLFLPAASRDVIFTICATTETLPSFAVRTKIFPYPSGIYALWIMISVSF